MKRHDQLLAQCEEALRSGQIQKTAKLLSEIAIPQIHRDSRLALANLCRRAGLVSLGLRILSPVIHEQIGIAKQASPDEWAEYAVLLQRSGVVGEALQILSRPEMMKVGSTHLYRAFCHFNRWEYAEAVPSLETYLDTDLPDYSRLVGKTNLAAALIALKRDDEALPLIEMNLEQAREGQFKRILGNNLELRAIAHVDARRFSQAKTDLADAVTIIGSSQTLDQLFVRKWMAAIEGFETGKTTAIENFRKEALARRDYESVREADLLSLQIRFSNRDFEYLYFGTPFAPYKGRIREALGQSPPSKEFRLGLSDIGPLLDIQTGVAQGYSSLEPGSKGHQLLEILFRDFYKPLSVGGLFSELFGGERFHIESSPDRVHQILRRTRRWLAANGYPLEIEERGQLYSARLTGSLSVLIPLERAPAQWETIQLKKLDGWIATDGTFTAQEARKMLGLSTASFKRFASWGIETGIIEKFGAGSATVYQRQPMRKAA